MEQEKQIVKLNLESYSRLKQMLESADEESHDVVISMLDEHDVKENLVYLLTFIKESNRSIDWWMKRYKNVNLLVNIVNKNPCFLSYMDILNSGLKYNIPSEDVEFVLQRYNNYILETVVNKSLAYAASPIKDVTIILS